MSLTAARCGCRRAASARATGLLDYCGETRWFWPSWAGRSARTDHPCKTGDFSGKAELLGVRGGVRAGLGCQQELGGVLRGPAEAHFEVQVRSGGAPGR